MKVKFCGAATGVTGSCHMISAAGHKILLDCGQFQGNKTQEAENSEPFPFDVSEIECVLVSHAHIDHCGRLPLLVKRGFNGPIYCTDATADLLKVMLADSGYIHEKEAEWKNKKNARLGRPLIEPLYTVADSDAALALVQPVMYDQLFEVNEQMKAVFNDAGHILGSAITELWTEEDGNVSKLVFSGDLGVMDRPILRNPTVIKKADYLIMETTYGNRLHPANSTSIDQLLDIVIKTTRRGGSVVIPSFAVGRTQELIYEFNKFYEHNEKYHDELSALNVYIDSPMATTATEVFRNNAQVFDEETKNYILEGDNPLDFPNLKFTRSTADSQALNNDRAPKIIISASGMCEAGRIRHHLKHNLWDARNSIVFVGYQAEGSLGRTLVSGASEVSLFGEIIQVNAEIYNLEGFSGHADQAGLMEWLGGFQAKPSQIFLVHGEAESKRDFADKVKAEMGYDCTVVSGYTEYELAGAEIINREEAVRQEIDSEEITGIRRGLDDVCDEIEKILYSSALAMTDTLPPEKVMAIKELLLSLEKSTMKMGSIVFSEDSHDPELTLPEE